MANEQEADGSLAIFRVPSGAEMPLSAIRRVSLRVGRLAEALLGVPEADVVVAFEGRVWRAKGSDRSLDDAATHLLAMLGDTVQWTEDARLDPHWGSHPSVAAENGIRFYAAAPIRLRDGVRVGSLRVFDQKPRPFDAHLAERLTELADFVADECERLLSEDVRRLRQLFEQAPGFVAIMQGPGHVFEMANPAYAQLLGGRDVIGQAVREALPELKGQGFFELLDKVFASGEPYLGHAIPVRLHGPDAASTRNLFLDFVYQPIVSADGSVTGVFLQGQDVTNEKLAIDRLVANERELRAALAATQAIFDRSQDVICTIDADGRFRRVSKHAATLWGYAPEELCGRALLDFVHPDDQEATLAANAAVMSGSPTSSFRNRILNRDGSQIHVMWSSVWSKVEGVCFAIARDMREQMASETMLQQAQKMEAVGALTGGMAHDFNNLLTVVIGSTEGLVEKLPHGSEDRSLAELALSAAERGAELVKQLLAFSRKQDLAPQNISCAEMLRSILPLVQHAVGAGVEVVVEQSDDLIGCVADPIQLQSAILNLCINGRDAMPEGGTLTIMISATEIPEVDPTTYPLMSPGRFAVLSVRDNGDGMSADTARRAADPFFTTKSFGKGSGLGLSMVYGFVTQSGGRLTIDTAVGQGTTVTLLVPSADYVPAAMAEERPVLHPLTRKHVLVAEDDDLVRSHLTRQLEALGYQVTACANGTEALHLLAANGDVDLLMTDMVMPGGMNGRQLNDHARLFYPQLKVLFTTGYADEALPPMSSPERIARVLPKPYRRAQLAEIVSLVLGE